MSIIQEIIKFFRTFFAKNEDIEKEKTSKENQEEKKIMEYKISMDEILKGKSLENQSEEIQNNLNILLERINKIRNSFCIPMVVSSGLRTMEDHLRIYKEKAEKSNQIFDESKIPMKSKHLFGKAVDIYDPNGKLQAWCLSNISILEEAELWCEDFKYTPNWVHFQIEPPRSGKRFFIP